MRSPSAEIAGLRGPYFAWLVDHGLPPNVDRDALWHDTLALVDLAANRAGLTDLHVWTPDQVQALSAAADEQDDDVLAALPLLLAFLGDTDRWAGTDEEFAAVLQAAEEVSSPLVAVLEALAEVSVDPDAEDAALAALPVVRRAEALLRFLLPRRRITSTGALRKADLSPAAELVGLDLEGRRIRSMWDLPPLATLWTALREAGLIELTATEAIPTPVAFGWVTGEVEPGREARRLLARSYLTTLLTAPVERWEPDPLEPLLPGLAAAALDQPMPLDLALGGGIDDDEDIDADLSPAVRFVAAPARELLDRLADEGFLVVTDTVAAVPGLRRVLADVVAPLVEATELDGGGSGAALRLPPPDPAAAGQTWRLRVELENADPPIWREVLVDPGIHLDELHLVIQRLFDWEGYHLHDFTLFGPGRHSTRFTPVDPYDNLPMVGDPPIDESRVQLSQVAGPRRRSKLVYQYDFGDSWDHRITVVGTESAGDPDLPRCTGGSGAPPAEDSGGVWGWARMVAVSRDPHHPEHADVREWLGLDDGEQVDPVAFDPADANRRLAVLRRSDGAP